MAKTKYTNREALHMIVTFLNEHGCEDADLVAKVDAMAASADKRAESAKNTPRAKSKEQVARESLAGTAADIIRAHGEPVTAEWVAENVPGVFTASGANGLMRTAKRLGLVVVAGKVRIGKTDRVVYKAV